jgi:hypothetical protein
LEELLMNKHQAVQSVTPGQTKDLAAILTQAIPSDLSFADAQHAISKKSDVIAKVRKILRRTDSTAKPDLGLDIGKVSKEELAGLSVGDLVRLQEFFYEQVYGLYVQFPGVLIPQAPSEFGWPVCMLGNLTAEDAFNGGSLNLPRWKCTDGPLDAELDLSRGRDAWRRSYVVLIRANWEADDDLKNICRIDMDKRGTDVLMFRERLHIGGFLFWLTGEHLDRKTVTLTGSRCLYGDLAGVYFNPADGKIVACRCRPTLANDRLRFRQAVSLPPQAD